MDAERKAREAIDRHNGGYPYYAVQCEFTMPQTDLDKVLEIQAKAALIILVRLGH